MASSDTCASRPPGPAKAAGWSARLASGVPESPRQVSAPGNEADCLLPTMEWVDLYSRPAPSPMSHITFATTGYLDLGFPNVASAEIKAQLAEGGGKRTKKVTGPSFP